MSDRAKPDAMAEVPGVGVYPQDLHFVARLAASALGCPKPASAIDIVQGAATRAVFELRYIAENLEREDMSGEVHHLLLNVADRLEAAAETAKILWKLHQLPSCGQAEEASE